MAVTAVDSANEERFRFSRGGGFVGVTTADGRLVVIDAQVNAVRSEFVPSSHLATACTCLAWRPHEEESHEDGQKKHRKRKSSVSQSSLNGSINGASDSDSDLIVVGTSSGTLLLYSMRLGDVKTSVDKAHAGRVNDVTWNRQGSIAYSCSADGHIGKYNMRKSNFSKFRLDIAKKQKLYSLVLHPSEASVVVGAFASILWVDLDTQVTLRTFNGHVGEVVALELFTTSGPDSVPFLLSAATGERDYFISVWKLDDSTEEKPQATLSVNEAVRSMTVAGSSAASDSEVLIGCLTKTGVFQSFEYNPESKRKKKALKPSATVQVATEKDAKGRVIAIPILASQQLGNGAIRLMHGSHVRPAFETVEHEKLEKLTCLIRSIETTSLKPQIGTKHLVPDTSKVTVLAPGPSMVPRVSSTTESQGGTKRKSSKSGKIDELPMIERLRLLAKESDPVMAPPRTDSLLQLLLQGLHNKDRRILDSVLDRADSDLIDKTVRKLPVEGVIPLIQELQHYIKGRGMLNQSHAKWLRLVLQHHTAFLMSNPRLEELLVPVSAMLEERTRHYAALVQLKGKLDIMTRQIASKAEASAAGGDLAADKEALLVYQDDSSDELSDVLDELLLPPSDVEDNWNLDDDDEEQISDKDDEGSDDGDDVKMANGVDSDGSDDEMESD